MSWQVGVSCVAAPDRGWRGPLSSLVDSGVHGVELGTPPERFDPWRHDELATLGPELGRLGLQPVAVHVPLGGLLDLAAPNAHHRQAAVGAVLATAAAFAHLGGQMLVVHPTDLERSRHDVAERLADSARSLDALERHCARDGLTLCVESPAPHVIGGRPEEFHWLLGRIGGAARACLDTGHLHLGNQWREFVQAVDGRLHHVHAHDNHGYLDEHLPPGEGTVDWREIGTTLQAVGFNGWIMLEVACPRSGGVDYRLALDRVRDVLAPV